VGFGVVKNPILRAVLRVLWFSLKKTRLYSNDN